MARTVLTLLVALALFASAHGFVRSYTGKVFYPTKESTDAKIPGGSGPVLGLVNDPDVPVTFDVTIEAITYEMTLLASENNLPANQEVVLLGADRRVQLSFGDDGFGPLTYDSGTAAEPLEPSLHYSSQVFRGLALTHDFIVSGDPYRLRIDGQLWVLVKRFDDFSVAASGFIDIDI